MKLNGYGAYVMYLAMKAHFTTDNYDFIKYGGKTNASEAAYNNRKDRYYFEKLARKYDADQLRDFYLVNFMDNPNVWAGDLANKKEPIERFERFTKYHDGMLQNYANELVSIFDNGFQNGFLTENGIPNVYSMMVSGQIMPETFIITDQALKMTDNWDTKAIPLYDKMKWKLDKYARFLNFNKTSAVEIFQTAFHNSLDRIRKNDLKEIH